LEKAEKEQRNSRKIYIHIKREREKLLREERREEERREEERRERRREKNKEREREQERERANGPMLSSQDHL